MSPNWLNKIQNHQETPPQGVWENIAQRLDNEALQERMNGYGETPPAAAWKNIEALLEEEEGNKMVQMAAKNTRRMYFRIAAAACLVAAIVFFATLLNRKDQPVDVNIAAGNTDLKKEEPGIAAKTDTPVSVSSEQTEKIASLHAQEKRRSIKKEKPVSIDTNVPISYAKVEDGGPLVSDPSADKWEKLKTPGGEEPNDIAMMNTPSSGHITITGPNGEPVKVSAKFSNIIRYIADDRDPASEEYIDKVIQESKFWKGKFRAWKEKMINTTLAPSPANFMDIIELSKLVKEKEKKP